MSITHTDTHILSAAVWLCGHGPCSAEFLSRLKRLPSGGGGLKTEKVMGGGGNKKSGR